MSYTLHLTKLEKVFSASNINENHTTMNGNAMLTSEELPFLSYLIMLCGSGFIPRWMYYGTRENLFS